MEEKINYFSEIQIGLSRIEGAIWPLIEMAAKEKKDEPINYLLSLGASVEANRSTLETLKKMLPTQNF